MDTDIAVIGGGVIGCAIARELASTHDVAVFEKGQIASAASGRAAGEITVRSTYTGPERKIADHALEFFREYDGTGQFTFHERSSMGLVRKERESAARSEWETYRDRGHDVEWLSVEEIEAEYDRFRTDELVGGIRWGDSGFVDPYTFSVTLQEDAENDGAAFRTNTEVTDLLLEDDQVHGVVTDEETIEADHVVVAAGWWSERLLRDIYQIPVQPYRTQCLVFEPEEPLSDHFPMGWIPGEHVYFRAEENGDLLVGGWSFAESNPEDASRQADEEFREHVAEVLPRFFAGFDTAGVIDGWAGCDAATPDTRPIIDAPEDAPDGLVIATGFHGRGIMTAPIVATLVGDLIADRSSPLSTSPFRIDRFESRSPDFEFTSISAGGDTDDHEED